MEGSGGKSHREMTLTGNPWDKSGRFPEELSLITWYDGMNQI